MNSISFALEPDSKIRLYHQLYEKISDLIKNGDYPKNSKLPSIRTVATKLDVSKNTVTKAYELLEKNHFIYSEQKKGYFVSDLSKSVPIDKTPKTPAANTQQENDIPTVESILRQRLKTQDETSILQAESADDDTKLVQLKQGTESVTKQPPIKKPAVKKEPEPSDPMTIEEKLASCYSTVLIHNTDRLKEDQEPFGQPHIKQALQAFLSSYLKINCCEEQVVIGASKDSLLASIIQLQSLNTPYIKSQGVGLLHLANQFTEGSLTTVKAIAAIAEDTDAQTKKIFSVSNLPVKEVPVNEFGLDSDFLITSGATSIFTIPGDSPEFSVNEPDEYYRLILAWANQASYRYIIEYDTESFLNKNSLVRFKSLDANDKVIYINSFENLLPLGMKLSFAVLPKAILADFQQKYDSFSCPVSLLEQAAMTEFINKGYLNDYLSTLKNI